MITFYSEKYRCLELFPETHGDNTVITLSDGMHTIQRKAKKYCPIRFPLEKYTVYQLHLGSAEPGLMYLTESDSLLQTGIRFLLPDGSLHPLPPSSNTHYHLTPCGGQLLTLGSPCFHNGLYHLFYACAPFPSMPTRLCCGHAVSPDLIRWRHLPVFCDPWSELTESGCVAGGLLPGGIEIRPGFNRAYFIRRIHRYTNGTLLREYPVYADTRDMIHFSDVKNVYLDTPTQVGPFCRSPRILPFENETYCILGGTYQNMGALLFYRLSGEKWTFLHPLLREKEKPVPENIDFFPLGRSYAAIASYPEGEKHSVRWYTGSCRDGIFCVRNRGSLAPTDDLCGLQSFTQDGKTTLFGVIAGENSCITLPRTVSARFGQLCTGPSAAVSALTKSVIYATSRENLFIACPTSSFRIEICFSAPTDFCLHVGTPDKGVTVQKIHGTLLVKTIDSELPLDVISITRLSLFLDGPILEMFVNDGISSIVKRFSGNDGTCHLSFAKPECAEQIEIAQLRDLYSEATEEDLSDPDEPLYTFDFTDPFMQ